MSATFGCLLHVATIGSGRKSASQREGNSNTDDCYHGWSKLLSATVSRSNSFAVSSAPGDSMISNISVLPRSSHDILDMAGQRSFR